ncbi:hypothetical protein ColLi_03528 [Colletotrichum liriopes]|uniref:Uncharacterized protein n=1 Tax=Colletotrichum liriopes TaxID=708192 RepID=A0AA37GGW4_9PEZI|nr:hypothetical protein ColLi_03528 [Colletotrichum liriopes]
MVPRENGTDTAVGGGRPSRTINVLGSIQVNAQDAAVGERQNEDVIRDLGGDKVGGDRELQLDSLDDEHGQRGVVEVEHPVAGGKAVGWVQSHDGYLGRGHAVIVARVLGRYECR